MRTLKYIGSKRRLAARILAEVPTRSLKPWWVDIMAGAGNTAFEALRAGYQVMWNDTAEYSFVLGRGLQQEAVYRGDAAAYSHHNLAMFRARQDIATIIADPSLYRDHWFVRYAAINARYLTIDNAARIAGARELIQREINIAVAHCHHALNANILLSADAVDSTVGLQMAYLKSYAPRALRDFQLRDRLWDGGDEIANLRAVTCDDAEFVKIPRGDVTVYVDPPYNQHSYYSNYHVWETLMRWDDPETYGIANKRVQCRTTKSPWNTRDGARDAAWRLVKHISESSARRVAWSTSDEAFLTPVMVAEMLNISGFTPRVVAFDHARHIGHAIGIHDLEGKVVGKVGKKRLTEYLVVGER